MRKVDVDGLRMLEQTDGIVFKRCGGDLQERVNEINRIFEQEGFLLSATGISDICFFENAGQTDLLLLFDKAQVDMEHLAKWRLKTYPQIGGTWLPDYLKHQLCNFPKARQKPDCLLVVFNENIFDLMEAAARSLREYGQDEQAREMIERITKGDCYGYDSAFRIISEYVNVTSIQAAEDMGEEGMEIKMGN